MIATARDIELILDRILACCRPTTIYLFGSQARGDANADSDVDLLIVEPSKLRRRHRGGDVASALTGFAAGFDLLFYTPEELARELANPLSFASGVVAAGRPIYPAPSRSGAPAPCS
jgi:predicted nucleotidyltransferase